MKEGYFCGAGNELYDELEGCGEHGCEDCIALRRKYPTPEQFREEYGREVPEDMPVWGLDRYYYSEERKDEEIGWRIALWSNKTEWADKLKDRYSQFVVACTPWGKPPNDWRPE